MGAAELLQSSSRPLLCAAAAEDAGGQLARADHPDKALDRLNAAFDIYLRHEALADARRVGRQLRRLGVHRRIVSRPRAKTGWDSLTDSERRVVNVIAQGATNRSAAERLHVTPHTVKAHLHNAFAKLGINSRAQLSKLMQGTDRPTKIDCGDLAITRPGLKDCPPGNGVTHTRAATVVVVNQLRPHSSDGRG